MESSNPIYGPDNQPIKQKSTKLKLATKQATSWMGRQSLIAWLALCISLLGILPETIKSIRGTPPASLVIDDIEADEEIIDLVYRNEGGHGATVTSASIKILKVLRSSNSLPATAGILDVSDPYDVDIVIGSDDTLPLDIEVPNVRRLIAANHDGDRMRIKYQLKSDLILDGEEFESTIWAFVFQITLTYNGSRKITSDPVLTLNAGAYSQFHWYELFGPPPLTKQQLSHNESLVEQLRNLQGKRSWSLEKTIRELERNHVASKRDASR